MGVPLIKIGRVLRGSDSFWANRFAGGGRPKDHQSKGFIAKEELLHELTPLQNIRIEPVQTILGKDNIAMDEVCDMLGVRIAGLGVSQDIAKFQFFAGANKTVTSVKFSQQFASG